MSDEALLPARLNELSHTLKQRKYPTEVINTGIQKAMSIPRAKLIEVKNKELKIKQRSFKSSEHISEKGNGPYRGFGHLSLFSDPIDLATWSQRELL